MAREETLDELAASLPDLPRWVAARGLLRERRCDVIFSPEGKRGAGFLVLERGGTEAFAVHRPVTALATQLLELDLPATRLLVPIESSQPWRALLPGWREQPVVVHVHPQPASLPRPTHPTRFLTLDDLAAFDSLPPALASELERSLARGPVAGAFEGERAVAFCRAAHRTESWFDLALDTLEDHRRHGLATSAAAFLIHHMLAQGRRPVWDALDADTASMAMAKKYGFRAVDRMMLFSTSGAQPVQ